MNESAESPNIDGASLPSLLSDVETSSSIFVALDSEIIEREKQNE